MGNPFLDKINGGIPLYIGAKRKYQFIHLLMGNIVIRCVTGQMPAQAAVEKYRYVFRLLPLRDMETLYCGFRRVGCDPSVAAPDAVSAEVDDVGTVPPTACAAILSMVERVTLSSAPFAQST